MKTALITGITGQDGSYLSKLLLNKKYRVIGLSRNPSKKNLVNLKKLNILDNIIIEKCDLLDKRAIARIIKKYQPHEIYNLAAQSSVGLSFKKPYETINFNCQSTLNILDTIKNIDKKIKFYQASSSEMFGKVDKLPINENTPFHPLSPYAVSKAASHWMTINYRESYGLFAICGILFNHESQLRDDNFFIKKIISDSVAISKNKKNRLEVGNINIKRDFGWSPKYVEAMWLMMQNKKAKDYIVCSGKSILLKDIIKYVFKKLNIAPSKLEIKKSLIRPTEIKDIYGDNKKIKKELAWDYDTNFYEIIDLLINEELNK